MLPQEPPDGDFVAYIEALQRASAARMGMQSTVSASAPDASPESLPHKVGSGRGRVLKPHPAPRPSSTAPGATAPTFNAGEAEQWLAQLARSPASARFISGGMAAAIGGLFLLYALVASGGLIAWLIGLGLLIWALPRMRRAARELPAADRQLARRIAATFGSRPPHA